MCSLWVVDADPGSTPKPTSTPSLVASYNTDLFDEATAAQMVDHYASLLAAAVAAPEALVDDLAMVSPDERERLLALASGPLPGTAPVGYVDYGASPHHDADPYQGRAGHGSATTLKELFEAVADRHGDRVALENADGTRTLSYAELDAAADAGAAMLVREHGVGPEVLVGLSGARSLDVMVAILAVLKAGGAYVPIAASTPAERMRFLASDAGLAAVLCEASEAEAFAATGVAVVSVDGWAESAAGGNHGGGGEGRLVQRHRAANLAYVIFTSGSTGTPKGVMVSNGAAVAYSLAMGRIQALEASDRVLQIMALTFDSSIFDLWMAWGYGGAVVLCGRWTAVEGLGAFMRERAITCLGCTPTQLGVMKPDEVPALRIAAIGGEAVPVPLIMDWLKHESCALYNQYGPTEATVTVTSLLCTPEMAHPTSIGYANPGSTSLYVVDGAGRLAPVGVPGELWIGGSQLARGYLNRAGLTAAKFVANPWRTEGAGAAWSSRRLYRSGDLCRWLRDGSVEYLGRIDSQVKLRGFRIELEEIEHRATELDEVRFCVVLMLTRRGSDGTAGASNKFLCAYLAPPDPADAPEVSVVDCSVFFLGGGHFRSVLL